MLYQWYQYRPYIIGFGYVYGLIGLVGVSVESLRQSTSLIGQLLGLVGLGLSVWLLRRGLLKVGLLELKPQPVIDQPTGQHDDLLKAKQALLKRLETHYLANPPQQFAVSSDDVLQVTKDEAQNYHCHFNYHDLTAGIFYNHVYIIDSNRKRPVYVKTAETLVSSASSGSSVYFEFDQPQLASLGELFELYQKLDCFVD